MDNKDQEKGMNERGDIVPQGPAQKEVNEVNKQKGPLRRPGFLGKIVNAGLALGMFGSVAALKAKAEENVTNPITPQTTTADGSAGSPQGAPVPDAPAEVEFKPTSRIFIPKVEKNFQEAPLRFSNKIERPEANLTIFMDKEESVRRGGLFENLVEFRKRFGPSLPLEVYFYDSAAELEKRFNYSELPWNQRTVQRIPYGAWASKANIYDDQGNYIETRQFPPAFESYGYIQYHVREGQVVEVHVSLPKLLPGAQPDPLQIEQVERQSQLNVIAEALTLDENGKSIFIRDIRAAGQYLRTNPLYILKPNQRLDQVALYIVP